MAYRITNNSKAPRGVHNAAGRLVFVGPGETKTIDAANIAGVRCLPFMAIEPSSDLPEPPAALVKKVEQAGKPTPKRAPARRRSARKSKAKK